MPWAVVTGASSGIGRAIAAECAQRKLNVVLVARREGELRSLADSLRKAHGVETRVLPCDLACPTAPAELHRKIADLDDVQLLVANAGVSWFGELANMPSEKMEQLLHLNVGAVAHLARLCGADFARRGHGALLLTGSLTALAPLPHAAMYGATRAFVRSLALGLRDELAPHGVAVTCVLPGATDTEFASTGGIESSLIFNLPLGLGPALGAVLPSETVACVALDALAAGRAVVVPGFFNRAYTLSTRMMSYRATAAFATCCFGEDTNPLAGGVVGVVAALPALLPVALALLVALPLEAARGVASATLLGEPKLWGAVCWAPPVTSQRSMVHARYVRVGARVALLMLALAAAYGAPTAGGFGGGDEL